MTALKFLRAWRIVVIAAMTLNVVTLVVNAVTGNPIVVPPIVVIPGLAVVLAFMTKVIRMRTEQLRPRPDYAHIARMERDIFGEAFEHDGGAPQVSRPRRQTCGYGHPLISDRPCKVCEYRRYRFEGPLPSDVIRSISQRDWSRDDAALIRSGAILRPGGTIILPSGEKIGSAEWARRGGRTS